jgi:hypothetical protein
MVRVLPIFVACEIGSQGRGGGGEEEEEVIQKVRIYTTM